MRFTGIILDFNGVLWWDSHLQEQAWRQFSTRIRGVPFSDEKMATHVHGRNNRHTLEYLVGHLLEKRELHQLTQQKEMIYRQLCLTAGRNFQLSPGAIELLDFLVGNGIHRTIATASERTNLDFFVQHLGLDRWFEVDRIVYDDGSRAGKPAPTFIFKPQASSACHRPSVWLSKTPVPAFKRLMQPGSVTLWPLGR